MVNLDDDTELIVLALCIIPLILIVLLCGSLVPYIMRLNGFLPWP